jgi:hypothetical protein
VRPQATKEPCICASDDVRHRHISLLDCQEQTRPADLSNNSSSLFTALSAVLFDSLHLARASKCAYRCMCMYMYMAQSSSSSTQTIVLVRPPRLAATTPCFRPPQPGPATSAQIRPNAFRTYTHITPTHASTPARTHIRSSPGSASQRQSSSLPWQTSPRHRHRLRPPRLRLRLRLHQQPRRHRPR